MEGGYLSNAAVERSKQRLQRLPYIERVEVETTPVPGTADLVDVDFEIKEGLPGQFSGGIGYSESQSVMLNGSFVHSNFMGTGERVAVEINAGQYSKVYSLSHTDPYTTIDGVSRTVSATFRDITQFTSASSDFATDDRHAGASTTATRSPSTSRCASGSRRSAPTCSPTRTAAPSEAVDWVRNNGNPYIESANYGMPPIAYDVLRHEVRHVLAGRSAGTSTRATAASSPTAARATASTSATRCRAATSSTTRSTTTTCSSCRSRGWSRSL